MILVFLLSIFLYFNMLIYLNHKIVIKNDYLIIWKFKKIWIPFNEIAAIYMKEYISNDNIIL